jgi:hypothetical protein
MKAVSARRKLRSPDEAYWVFVCNPKKWSIDQFLERGIEHDTWGVRPSDRDRFAQGQLGIVRVGVDQRNAACRGTSRDAGLQERSRLALRVQRDDALP